MSLNFDPKSLIIDLNFTHPEFISAFTGKQDQIVMHIRNNITNIPIYFISEQGYPLVNVTIRSDIPLQQCPDEIYDALFTGAAVVAVALAMILALMSMLKAISGGTTWQLLNATQTL